MYVHLGKLNLGVFQVLGMYLFGLGLLGIGIEHFIFTDFVLGRAPTWPPNWPGKTVWAFISGSLFSLVGIVILTGKRFPFVYILSSLVVFSWALLRHIPLVLSDSLLGGTWTSAGKALVFIGGFLAMVSISRKTKFQENAHILGFMVSSRIFLLIARICLSSFLIITGIQHFLFVEFIASLIPTWFPVDPEFWTYFSGMSLIMGGIGLVLPKIYNLAAYCVGIMIFSWFWIVHIPRVHLGASDQIAVFEALCFSGMAFMLAKTKLSKP